MDSSEPRTNTTTTPINKLFLKLPKSARGHVVAVLGEVVGTFFFLFFAFSGAQTGNVSSNPNTGDTVITAAPQKTPSQLLYVSLAFGFSLAVNAWVFFRISGGLFNPAVTLGMVLIGSITVVRGVLLFVAQMVGAIIAAYVVQALFTGKLNVSTTPSTTTTIAQAVIIEMILTAMLVFTIFMLAAEKHIGNFIAPIGIGLALFVAELTGQSELFLPIDWQNNLLTRRRRLLDRWFAKPRPLIRAASRARILPRNTLDLLGRALRRLGTSISHVQAHQITRV